MDISGKLLNHGVSAQAIIAGIDVTGPHIFKIIDPGEAVSFDTACFAAVGIGRYHAESSLMGSGFHKNLSEGNVIFSVYSAKVNAEIAAGVGDRTDLIIITGEGTIYATPEEVSHMRNILNAKSVKDKETETEAVSQVSAYLRTKGGK